MKKFPSPVHRAFTLIELLVVVAIIAILVALARSGLQGRLLTASKRQKT